jgi:hypothetical protein
MELTFTNGIDSIKLNTSEALTLELKLNVSSKKHSWSLLGDILYDFHVGRLSKYFYVITNEQLDFLNQLNARQSWKDCKTL